MSTDKTPKWDATGRPAGARDEQSATRGARPGRGGTRGEARAESRREARAEGSASRAFDFMRQRLSRDADRVDEKDINSLRSSVPEKLEAIDTKLLSKELEWVGEMIGRVRTLWTMLFDKEFVVDWKAKALVGAALLYFVLPTDLTPDFIPGIGYIDDALVLATLWRLLQDKLDEYISFKRGGAERQVSPARSAAAGASDGAPSVD